MGQARRGCYEVQAQAPEIAGVRGAVAVGGPSGEVRALLGLAAAPALHGRGVHQPDVVVPRRAGGCGAGRHVLDQFAAAAQTLVVAGAAGARKETTASGVLWRSGRDEPQSRTPTAPATPPEKPAPHQTAPGRYPPRAAAAPTADAPPTSHQPSHKMPSRGCPSPGSCQGPPGSGVVSPPDLGHPQPPSGGPPARTPWNYSSSIGHVGVSLPGQHLLPDSRDPDARARTLSSHCLPHQTRRAAFSRAGGSIEGRSRPPVWQGRPHSRDPSGWLRTSHRRGSSRH